MKRLVSVLAILFVLAVFIFVVNYLGTHDSIEKVVDVNRFELGKGRTVYLIGVAPSAEYEWRSLSEVLGEHGEEGDSVLAIVSVDTLMVERVRDMFEGKRVKLTFSSEFEPDSSSPDLHAYLSTKDGLDIGAYILEEGLAWDHPEHEHPRQEQYRELVRKAKQDSLGVWQPAETADIEVAE
ncbi:hypothetical protein GF324_01405 [bacterium]|nr:hypothetical protein [bacterium]